ncbi:MAG: hypothetical protein P4M01_09440 [Acidobacteriota bacterium]|nr:hypothetical protein [Acidobacteriota bacterium]
MKKLSIALMLALLLCAVAAQAATSTFTGFVTDTMCGKDHMMTGKDEASCVRACVKGGAKYALAVGDTIYILDGSKAQLDPVAGRKVTVSGELKGDTLHVSSIAEVK